MLYESTVAGMGVVEVSLDRVRELRDGRDGGSSSETCGAKQGVLSEQWQRPELYDSFYPRPLKHGGGVTLAVGHSSYQPIVSRRVRLVDTSGGRV